MLAAHNIATHIPTARYNAGGMGYMQPCRQESEYSWHSTSTTRYYAPSFEREITNGQNTDYTYIESPNGLIAAVKTSGSKHDAMLLATDHLGSIVGVWNASGTLLEEHRYTAWGQRTSSTQNPRLRRGFTGHEHLAQFGLIDMQARLYDPHLGRFLAPDPYVQAPENPMSFNRYTYCFNNPLKYTDPTGCFTEEEFREIMNEMHRLLDEANRMDQQLCVSFDGYGGGGFYGFGSMNGMMYNYDNGSASLTDVGMPFYYMHEGVTVYGRWGDDGNWHTTSVVEPSWWGTYPNSGWSSSWESTNMGGWNGNWMDKGHGGGGGGGGSLIKTSATSQTLNGTAWLWGAANAASNISRYSDINSLAAKKTIGRVCNVINAAATISSGYDMIKNWNEATRGDIAKFGVDATITIVTLALSLNPIGIVVLTGIQVANTLGVFDPIYEYINVHYPRSNKIVYKNTAIP